MQSIRAFIDRIEEKTAVLLLGEDESVTIQLPVEWLPKGAGEGVVLRLGFSIDAEETEAGKRRVQSLLDSMPNDP